MHFIVDTGFRKWVVSLGVCVDYFPHDLLEVNVDLGLFYIRFGVERR